MSHYPPSHHVGLDPLTFNRAARMLRASYKKHALPDPVNELRQRFHDDLLPSYRSARSVNNVRGQWGQSHRGDDTIMIDDSRPSLPGLGSEFWKLAKAYLYDFTPPPALDPDIGVPAKVFYPVDLSEIIDILKVLWANSPDVKPPQWDEAKAFKYEGNIVVRIPIMTTFDTYQDNEPITFAPRIAQESRSLAQQQNRQCTNMEHICV